MMLSMLPRECACSFKCFANREVWLLFRKARLCSLYLLINVTCLSYVRFIAVLAIQFVYSRG